MTEQIGDEAREVLTLAGEFAEFAERGFGFAGEDGAGEFEDLALGGEAEHGEDIDFLDFFAAKS